MTLTPTTAEKTRNNAKTGRASKAAGAGEIRFGFPEINIGSLELLMAANRLSATLTNIFIFSQNIVVKSLILS